MSFAAIDRIRLARPEMMALDLLNFACRLNAAITFLMASSWDERQLLTTSNVSGVFGSVRLCLRAETRPRRLFPYCFALHSQVPTLTLLSEEDLQWPGCGNDSGENGPFGELISHPA
jgi:hypothetical protein